MPAIQVTIHRDRLPRPVQAARNALKRIAAASPVTIKIEKVNPVVAFAVDPGKAVVQAEMDGSPAMPGELNPQFVDADCL